MSEASDLLAMLGEARGEGTGPELAGGTDVCVCPECSYTEPHERGVPCNTKMCPECDIPLTGGAGAPGSKAK
jgi:hypothetical protein